MDNYYYTNKCTDTTPAGCVEYQGYRSSITFYDQEKECLSQKEVNEDLYNIADRLYSDQQVENESQDITYPVEFSIGDAVSTHSNIIADHESRIEDIENNDYNNLNISGWGLNTYCLTDPCGDNIEELGQLVQILIKKVCQDG